MVLCLTTCVKQIQDQCIHETRDAFRRFDVTLTKYIVKRSQLVKLNHLHVNFIGNRLNYMISE